MDLWDRLVTLFRMMQGYGLRHYDLSERLPAPVPQAQVQTALVDRADREQRPADEIQARQAEKEMVKMVTKATKDFYHNA